MFNTRQLDGYQRGDFSINKFCALAQLVYNPDFAQRCPAENHAHLDPDGYMLCPAQDINVTHYSN